MEYFQNIHSLTGLKKQYRSLTLANHPDQGGDTAAMQQINLEFEKLYKLWEHNKSPSGTVSGYENDYCGASAKEYTEYVYNEYRWVGSNYKGQSTSEIIEILRDWLKQTYPGYRFSVRRKHHNSFYVFLLDADFVAFTPEAGEIVYLQVNHYRIKDDDRLTDRAKEVMGNVCDFVNSYNFDDSDSMTDYFHTNFYLNMGIGSDTHPYKIVIPKLNGRKGDAVPQFKHPEGAAHKAIRQALGKCRFVMYETQRHGKEIMLGEDSYNNNGQMYFYPLSYSSRKMAQKRMKKLQAAGIQCLLSGHNGGYILFRGYTEETEKALERERQEMAEAMKAWNERQNENQPKEIQS